MKKAIVLAVFAAFASSAMARTTKVCFGSTKSDDTKGLVVQIEVDRQEVSIKTVKGGDQAYDGKWKTYGTHVDGRDGKTYLEYEGPNGDYQTVIMVDEELLHKGSSGLLQFRARGEGFFNDVYVCKDDKK